MEDCAMAGRLFLILWLCLAVPAGAGASEKAKPQKIDPAVLTEGFLSAHPDLRWRREGMRAYEAGDYATALAWLKRAARYGDKASQALVAGIYWDGLGVAQDRPLAYAWMDLAAERLYPDFVMFRERYWNGLDEAGRAEAVERGQALYAEYGDEVAKPRLETILRRESRKTTGSRLGFVGNLQIIPNTGPLAGTGMTLSGDQYYASKYWEPKEYWQLQDEIWRAPVRTRVTVGDVEKADADAPPPEDD
jgi:hypothetical protein